jgi:syntaxin-binding protein 1
MIFFPSRTAPSTGIYLLPRYQNLPFHNLFLERYKFQSSIGEYEDKTAVLSDADSVWTAVRHMHMRETIDKLMNDFNKFLQENAGFKG